MHFMVAYVSREQSEATLASAVHLAAVTKSKLTIIKVLADPHSLGLVAELIASDEPLTLAKQEIQNIINELILDDVNAVAEVRVVSEIGEGIVAAAIELNVNMLFVGTGRLDGPTPFLMAKDPVAHYIVDHCPASVVLVRHK